MKKIVIVSLVFMLFSCGSTKPPMLSKPLYDVLFGSDYGGASFQFYEIITEEKEFNMLLKDKMIKPYVNKEDIATCNFILVNIGLINTSCLHISKKTGVSMKTFP